MSLLGRFSGYRTTKYLHLSAHFGAHLALTITPYQQHLFILRHVIMRVEPEGDERSVHRPRGGYREKQ